MNKTKLTLAATLLVAALFLTGCAQSDAREGRGHSFHSVRFEPVRVVEVRRPVFFGASHFHFVRGRR